MKCHILFSEKNKKNISKCLPLKILPRVLSVKAWYLGRGVESLYILTISKKENGRVRRSSFEPLMIMYCCMWIGT